MLVRVRTKISISTVDANFQLIGGVRFCCFFWTSSNATIEFCDVEPMQEEQLNGAGGLVRP